MKYDIYSNQLVLKQRFLRRIAFFNFTSFLNLFAIMRQKQKNCLILPVLRFAAYPISKKFDLN